MVQDRADAACRRWRRRRSEIVGARPTRRRASPASSRCSTPARRKVYADIDRVQAEMLGVPADRRVRDAARSISARPTSTTSTSSAAPTASPPRPTAPSATSSRDIANLKTRNDRGRDGAARLGRRRSATSPAPTACRATTSTPPPRCRASPCPAISTGQALDAMERLAAETLPDGFGFEWTELAYQEKQAGNTGAARLRRWRWCSSSWCWRRSTRAGRCRSR